MAKNESAELTKLRTFVAAIADISKNGEGAYAGSRDNLFDTLIDEARLLLLAGRQLKDDRIIVHYEKRNDTKFYTGGYVFGSLKELAKYFPEDRYRLVERPIATRRGSAMMGGWKMKIVISHVNPPIPDRSHDYCAYIDGEEENGRYGWGLTALDALKDFIENYEDDIE